MIAGFGIQFKYCKQTIDVDNANFGAVAVERKMLQGKPNIISFKKCAKCRILISHTWTAGKLMFDRQIVE
jgi:hypothetical protein